MRYEDLSYEDQRLLHTDLGVFEKHAAEELALSEEVYNCGYTKVAEETADYLEEAFDMSKIASVRSGDISADEKSYELVSYLERGTIEGLMKLGSDRYGDPLIYITPFMSEKLAAGGPGFLQKIKNFFRKAPEASPLVRSAVSDMATDLPAEVAKKGRVGAFLDSVKDYHKGAWKDIKGEGSLKYRTDPKTREVKGHMFGKGQEYGEMSPSAKRMVRLRGALKLAPHAAAAVGTEEAVRRGYKHYKEKQGGE